MKIPQADDVAKIIDLPLAIADGFDNPEALSSRYHFDRRQASYYLQATEILGLTKRATKGRHALSGRGQRFVDLTPTKRKLALVHAMLSLPVMQTILHELAASPSHRLNRSRLSKIASSRTGISGSTVQRRITCLIGWARWLADETLLFEVGDDSISTARDVKSN